MQISHARQYMILVLTVSSLFITYLYINTHGTFQFRENPNFLNYNMLGEAFLAGRLHLTPAPHPERVRASDPTDPRLPYPFIVDAIIWKGEHFFTQDPAPGLVHAAFLLLGGVGPFSGGLSTGHMICLFAIGSLIGLWFVLRVVQQSYMPDRDWILWLTWLAFALSGTQLYIVSRQVVYHEAIVAGMCCIIWGTYCFLLRTVFNRHVMWLALASLLWGLGVASRVTLIFYPAIFILCGLYLSLRGNTSGTRLSATAGALTLPLTAIVILLLLYNYERFGDFLDFGRTHITVPAPYFHVYLTLMNNSFRLDHVPYNLYHYFLALPKFSLHPPFLNHLFRDLAYAPGVLMSREMISSFLFTVPIVILVVPSRLLIRFLKADKTLALAVGAGALASLSTFILLLFYYRAVSRYLYEFTPLLFPLIMCNIGLVWYRSDESSSRGTILKGGIVVLVAANLFTGVCLALNGMWQ